MPPRILQAPIATITIAIATLFGDGLAAFFSLSLGKKGLGTSIMFGSVFGIIWTILAFVFLKPLCLIFGATENILPYALDYGRIIVIGFTFQIVGNTIHQPFFKNEVDLHAHKIRYRLHSSEETESPEAFADKVNQICSLYQSARKQSREGAHIVSTDEMTGVQALEHKYPDKLPFPGQCAKMEFEYIRHGTTSLIEFFDDATGRMEMPYLNSTRTEEDLWKR